MQSNISVEAQMENLRKYLRSIHPKNKRGKIYISEGLKIRLEVFHKTAIMNDWVVLEDGIITSYERTPQKIRVFVLNWMMKARKKSYGQTQQMLADQMNGEKGWEVTQEKVSRVLTGKTRLSDKEFAEWLFALSHCADEYIVRS